MSLAVAIQMDPVETIRPDSDSTFVLALEAAKRGHALYHYLPRDLTLHTSRVTARAHPLTVDRDSSDPARLGPPETLDLATMDVVLMRQDPPFDMSYISATHVLEHLQPETLVVNDPVSVRNAPEKLFAAHFDGLMPPTIVTSDRDEMLSFRAEHRDVIVKPLYGNGGAGVFHIGADDENFNALTELFTANAREPLVVQRYLPRIRHGDKRIILIDGEPAGAVLRVPAKGEARSNLHVGGTAAKTELDRRDHDICAAIGPTLREQGLVFVGIDVIGGYLTEINVTSPTGLQEMNRFDGVCLEARIWDAIEARLRAREAA
jgi:glutathione synthase